MPKGVPAAGFRVRGPNKPKMIDGVPVVKAAPVPKGKRGRPKKVVAADAPVVVKVPGKRGRPRKVLLDTVAVVPAAKPVEAAVVAPAPARTVTPAKVVEAAVEAPVVAVAPVSKVIEADGRIKFTSFTEIGARRGIIMMRDKYGCTDFSDVGQAGDMFYFFYRDPQIGA